MRIPIFIILLIAMSGAAHGQPTATQKASKIVIRAEEPQAAKPPTGPQAVAVLMIKLEVERGAVRSARVASSKRIASYAPKVFARRGGAWEVIIEGETRRSFFVDNPAWREAEAHPTSDNRYQWVAQTGSIDWPLVVPLYADGKALGARSITVRDTRTGVTILQTEI